jgi:signal transduction histidine kinase/HAMP domain-containing protein
MAQQAVSSLIENSPSRSASRSGSSLGLRGGLGKTLLTAFLLLAIIPLSILSFFTYHQIRVDTGRRLAGSLETIVSLKEAHLLDWLDSYERELALLADSPELVGGTLADRAEILASQLAALQASDPTLKGLILVDERNAEPIVVPTGAQSTLAALQPGLSEGRRLILATAASSEGPGVDPVVAVTYDSGLTLIGLLEWGPLQQIVAASDGQGSGVKTWLVTREGLAASGGELSSLAVHPQGDTPEGLVRALEGQVGSGAYTGLEGAPVFGAYRWIPDLDAGLLAEYPQAAALAAGNTVTAMLVGATLAVALITAAIAAAVTRRVTVPIVQLTETAAWMARGDLNQKVAVARRDEIGVLARAFNRMAAELRVLYGQLEAKVAERTRQLEEAHTRTRYYAMQLSISAEVARIASSIRTLDDLLPTVVKLIGDAFELHHVTIYLLDSSGQRAVWEAGSNGLVPSEVEMVGGASMVGQVASDGERRVLRSESDFMTGQDLPPGEAAAARLHPMAACEMALPLRSGRKMLGVLHLQSDRPDEFDASDEMVYQSLADQISIAIDNARAYAVERDTVQRLQELDRIQSQFLTNMSHALRTPLNSVIGFSRIMLKELDGPLTDLQRADLTTVYKSGRQLLGLMNDMFELSQLELGTAAFVVAEVNLAEIVEGVTATARALARGKALHLHEELPEALPVLYTDGQRVRQLILALLSHAIKFTPEGNVCLRVSVEKDQVVIRVSSNGVEISPVELESLFADPGGDGSGEDGGVPGFGLAISRRVVERLGGQIWVEARSGDVGAASAGESRATGGVVLAFSLPIEPGQVSGSDG